MSALPILDELRQAGVTVRRQGDRLKLAPAELIPPDLLERARAAKPAILAVIPDATGEQRARLRAIADREGIAPDLIDRLPDADLDGLHLWTDDGLATYARMIEADADRARGRVPRDWTQPAYCRRCGPVLLWPGAPSIVLGCPWCLTRRAGVPLPRPSVACATCAHWRPAAGTQAEGIGTCAAGHLGRYPHQRHGCADWKPAALRTAESSEPAP